MVIVTGNPDTRRDYTDVRDVVRAYRLLAARGEPGAYNVCSGRALSAAELVAALGEAAGARVRHEVDPARVRAHEVTEMRGSPARLRAPDRLAPRDPARPHAGRHGGLVAGGARPIAQTPRRPSAAPNCCATTRA